jgi:hypothetical protein
MERFGKFKRAVARQFETMNDGQLYRTDVEKGELWSTYLDSFPPGTNPIFRERREYDCQTCKSFVRAVGSAVTVVDGALVSLWDCTVEEPYATVAAAMSELVKNAPIKNILLHDQKNAGVDKNYQDVDGDVLTWEHFHVVLPDRCVSRNRGTEYGNATATMEVFRRALEEITTDAVETVVELVDQGSLYRGEEHLRSVQSFGTLQSEYAAIDSDRGRELFVWRQDISPAIARIRNSAIGTLLVDLSEGKSLDAAVRSFEAKVAPHNYKRPKALVTKAMVERARKAVEDMGYGPALGRRFAVVDDVAIGDVLFANRDARKAMDADVFDEIAAETRATPRSLDKVEKVPIDVFIDTILPKASAIELLFENRHAGNLVNLVAPSDQAAKPLFKWPNNFSWSYNGDLADSIKERVKARGGSVTGDFRASLAWFNSDDLDLHLVEPRGQHIYYGHRESPAGGNLDVDMNVGESGVNFSRNAVENITYPHKRRMIEGAYHLFVNNYTHRERVDVGFEVEVEFNDETVTFACDREVRPRENVTVARFNYTHKDGLKFKETLPRHDVAKELWGISTQQFHPVTLVMLSPNHWNGRPTGNKHWFFMLQDCQREGSSRGFFNEYLSDDLREHRKVFEILGSKMRTETDGEQLSGLGFSSTRRNNVLAKVSGSFDRTINIVF